jgi:hypothetical protein
MKQIIQITISLGVMLIEIAVSMDSVSSLASMYQIAAVHSAIERKSNTSAIKIMLELLDALYDLMRLHKMPV